MEYPILRCHMKRLRRCRRCSARRVGVSLLRDGVVAFDDIGERFVELLWRCRAISDLRHVPYVQRHQIALLPGLTGCSIIRMMIFCTFICTSVLVGAIGSTAIFIKTRSPETLRPQERSRFGWICSAWSGRAGRAFARRSTSGVICSCPVPEANTLKVL